VVLAVALSAVRARERRRDVLAARARHEVRGPLCAARVALDGLERCARVEAIDAELRRAALALDELAAGRRVPRRRGAAPVDVRSVLRDSEVAWHALAASHGKRLALDVSGPSARVTADPLRLTQACANLVANAIEHGGEDVSVRVVLSGGEAVPPGDPVMPGHDHSAAPVGGSRRFRAAGVRGMLPALSSRARHRGGAAPPPAARLVRIEVADSGPGLPAPLPVLLAAARGRRSARGHGLAIAASIAASHGGRLTDSGGCVAIELPAAEGR
jgi:signal transduction histidine kinase